MLITLSIIIILALVSYLIVESIIKEATDSLNTKQPVNKPRGKAKGNRNNNKG
jgi:hypothetical protein